MNPDLLVLSLCDDICVASLLTAAGAVLAWLSLPLRLRRTGFAAVPLLVALLLSLPSIFAGANPSEHLLSISLFFTVRCVAGYMACFAARTVLSAGRL